MLLAHAQQQHCVTLKSTRCPGAVNTQRRALGLLLLKSTWLITAPRSGHSGGRSMYSCPDHLPHHGRPAPTAASIVPPTFNPPSPTSSASSSRRHPESIPAKTQVVTASGPNQRRRSDARFPSARLLPSTLSRTLHRGASGGNGATRDMAGASHRTFKVMADRTRWYDEEDQEDCRRYAPGAGCIPSAHGRCPRHWGP